MFRALLIALAVPTVAMAQAPQFRWVAGEAMAYRVSQQTSATETIAGKPQVTTTKLDLVKRWKVVAIDPAGVATLTMTVDSLRMETKTPTGETMLFDSLKLPTSTAGLREEMAKYVGVPVVTVRLDARGQLVEVKESKFGPPSRLQAELPFKLVLPTVALAGGQAWDRKFAIKLEPPQGAGESYDAVQKLTCKAIIGTTAVMSVATTLVSPPDSPAEQIPLLPLLPAGEIVFDVKAGRMLAVKYQYQKEIAGHQGEESKYLFVNSYVEEIVQ